MTKDSRGLVKGFKEEFRELHEQSERIRIKWHLAMIHGNFSYTGKQDYIEYHQSKTAYFEKLERELAKKDFD